jgi:hypothetical protein
MYRYWSIFGIGQYRVTDQGLTGYPEIIDVDVTPQETYLTFRGLVKKAAVGKPTSLFNDFDLHEVPDAEHSSIRFDVETTEPPSEIWLLRFIHYTRLGRDTTEAMALLPLDDDPDRYIRVGWASLDTWEFFEGVAMVDVIIV